MPVTSPDNSKILETAWNLAKSGDNYLYLKSIAPFFLKENSTAAPNKIDRTAGLC
jgi:hypothetical protein